MLPEKFCNIIIESSKHLTKDDFYDSQMNGLQPQNYAQTLLDTYSRLEKILTWDDPGQLYLKLTFEAEGEHNLVKSSHLVNLEDHGLDTNYDETVINLFNHYKQHFKYRFPNRLDKNGNTEVPNNRYISLNIFNKEIDSNITYDFGLQELQNLKPELDSYCEKIFNHGKEEQKGMTFETVYNFVKLKEKLNKIRENLLKEKMISHIEQDKFEYLFSVKPRSIEMNRLNWIKTRPYCHTFLSLVIKKTIKRIVKGKEEYFLDFEQINDCIKFPDGKKLDPQDKQKGDTLISARNLINARILKD
jgi:hypothetical protein